MLSLYVPYLSKFCNKLLTFANDYSDPFVAMAKHKKKYGFTVALLELRQTVPTLFRKVTDYKAKHKIPSTNLWNTMINPSWLPQPFRPLMSRLGNRDASGDAWNLCHFWSNFEIADMDWFRTQEYRDFFEYLDLDGGFYFERVDLLGLFDSKLTCGSGETHRYTLSQQQCFLKQKSCITLKILAMSTILFNRARRTS